MKIELSNVDGYHTYAYLEQAQNPDGYYNLKITSQWETAKNPQEEHTKISLLLSPDAFNNLKTLLK